MTPAPKVTPGGTTARLPRVVDIINTHECARELLDHRVAQVNSTRRYHNAICCSSGEYVQRLRDGGHTVHVIDTPRNLNPARMAMAIWRTYRLLRRERFDLVHTHTSVVGLIGRMAAALARTPVVIHQVHGFHHQGRMSAAKRWAFVQTERLLARLADRLLFQGQEEMNDCLTRRIAPADKAVLIGNGVQLDVFSPEAAADADPPVVLYVARFEPVKNHGMLLEAAGMLRDRGVKFVVKLVGDGWTRADSEAWVRRHELTEQVRFLGYRDDVPALMAGAAVCVLVSIKEGVPRAILEAAAGGRPMVATDVMGSRDAVLDGQTGFLVPLHDAAALADRLQTLLANPDLRRRMGRAGRELARERFDERKVTERIIQVYDRLTANL